MASDAPETEIILEPQIDVFLLALGELVKRGWAKKKNILNAPNSISSFFQGFSLLRSFE